LFIKKEDMHVERLANNKIVLTMSSDVDMNSIQRLIDFGSYLEATSQSKAKQIDIDKLADEVNQHWWDTNKQRFTK